MNWLWISGPVAVTISLVLWLRQLDSSRRALHWGLALVLGGAAGNLIDRALFGYVIDFIDVYYEHWHWPAFNIADIAISAGAGLMILDLFTHTEAYETGPHERKN